MLLVLLLLLLLAHNCLHLVLHLLLVLLHERVLRLLLRMRLLLLLRVPAHLRERTRAHRTPASAGHAQRRRRARPEGRGRHVAIHPVEAHLVLHLFALLLRHAPKFNGISRHAQSHALLQPAVLAPVSRHPLDHAVLLPGALVVHYGRLAAPEETLAPLAGDHSIVHARRLVAAHLARDYLDLG